MAVLGEDPPEALVGRLLRQAGMTLALAESCTGGLVAHRITDVPGSSDYFVGGIVSYSNDIKERVLGVQRTTLRRYGAVSEQTALEMARGGRRVCRADVALALTGVAGPGGGTPDKPVGLVYVALATRDGEWFERHVWDGDRLGNKQRSAEAALDLLCRYLEGRL
jgi:PncC family amidohydrolase